MRHHHHCGTKSPSAAQQISVERDFAAARRTASRSLLATTITVNVKFTIFTTVAKPAKNTSNVPDSVILSQVAVLNKYFAPYVSSTVPHTMPYTLLLSSPSFTESGRAACQAARLVLSDCLASKAHNSVSGPDKSQPQPNLVTSLI